MERIDGWVGWVGGWIDGERGGCDNTARNLVDTAMPHSETRKVWCLELFGSETRARELDSRGATMCSLCDLTLIS